MFYFKIKTKNIMLFSFCLIDASKQAVSRMTAYDSFAQSDIHEYPGDSVTCSDDVCDRNSGSMSGGEESLDDSKSKLKRNKFCSLSSLKQEMFGKQHQQQQQNQLINKTNSYVSEIKLFFDNNSNSNQLNSSNCFDIESELKISVGSPSESPTDSFRVNIKDLISKFEKNK